MSNGIGTSTQASDPGSARVTGTLQPDGSNRRIVAGGRFTGVTTLASITIGLAFVRDVDLQCISMSPALAVNFVCTQATVADVQFVGQVAPTVSGTGALQAAGVPATAFLPYAICADLITGFCLKANIPFTSTWMNITVATSAIDLTLVATVRPGPTC